MTIPKTQPDGEGGLSVQIDIKCNHCQISNDPSPPIIIRPSPVDLNDMKK